MKLRAKLLALLFAVALLPLVLVSVLSFGSARELLTNSIQTELATRTRSELDGVMRRLARSVGDLRTWSQLRIMQDVLIDAEDGELGKELARLGERYDAFESLSVLNQAGVVVASSDAALVGTVAGGDAAFEAATRGEVYQGAVNPGDGPAGATLRLAEPIRADYDRDTTIGVLVGVIDWSRVQSMLASVVVVGRSQGRDRRLVLIDVPREMLLYDSLDRNVRALDSGLADLPRARDVQELSIDGDDFLVGTATGSTVGELADPHWRLHTLIAGREAYAAVDGLRDRFVLIVATVAIAIFVLGMFWANRVSRPLSVVSGRLQDIASGEGDLTVTLDVPGRDEIASLAHAFNRFVAKIRTMVHELANAGTAIQVSVEDLSGIAERTSQDVDRQRAETDAAVATVEEMVATVTEVADSAAFAAEASRNAGEEAHSGAKIVADSVESIDALAGEVERAQIVIEELAQDGDRIGRILDVIAEVAAQANILAINASIEAAAAGERGAGFSVVANEVRMLSQRVSDATGEVQEIIGGLRDRTGEAVRAMEASRGRAGESVDRARAVTEALARITGSIDTISQMSDQIADSTGRQVSATDGIRERLHRVTQIGDGTADGARNTETSADNLRQQIAALFSLVNQFKTQ